MGSANIGTIRAGSSPGGGMGLEGSVFLPYGSGNFGNFGARIAPNPGLDPGSSTSLGRRGSATEPLSRDVDQAPLRGPVGRAGAGSGPGAARYAWAASPLAPPLPPRHMPL